MEKIFFQPLLINSQCILLAKKSKINGEIQKPNGKNFSNQ